MGNLSFGLDASSYYDWCKRGRVYSAFAVITAPVAYSTAAGIGGPLLWNDTNTDQYPQVNAVILAVSADIVTASTVAATLGITGNSGQTAAPSSTTAITATANTFIGGGQQLSGCNVYNVGTVTNAGNFFLPTHSIGTGAVTVSNTASEWVDIGGSIVVPPGSWASIAGSVAATTAVINIGILWAEIPIA